MDSHARSKALASWAAALVVGFASGTFAWSLWWPHSDRGSGFVGLAFAIIGLGVVLAAYTPARSRWLSIGLVMVVAGALAYGGLVLITRDRCGNCPPWISEREPVRVTVPAGDPVPPLPLEN